MCEERHRPANSSMEAMNCVVRWRDSTGKETSRTPALPDYDVAESSLDSLESSVDGMRVSLDEQDLCGVV